MKSPRSAGLLLLQSVASSALRHGVQPTAATGRSRAAAATRSLAFLAPSSSLVSPKCIGNEAQSFGRRCVSASSTSAYASNSSHCATTTNTNSASSAATAAAAAAAAVGLASGAVAVTSCSNDESNAEDHESVAVNKSIDSPLQIPHHDPDLPFPPSSLKHDTYNGVTLDVSKLPNSSAIDATKFESMLDKALQIWIKEKKRGIWIRIPTDHARLVPATTCHGFDFQHAEPGQVVLTKWLPKESASRLPHGPTHQVGVGALVMHPFTGKMLAVQERTGPAAARKLWKMPTGLTDPGEDIAHAAVRELREETGLECVFDRIICFRQAHGGLFNRSDMFFVCLCRLAPHYEEKLREGSEIELLPQEEEILCADWIDMEDYAHQGVWKESPLYKEMNGAMLKAARHGIEYAGADTKEETSDHGFVAKELPVGFRPGSNTIYVSSKL